MKIRLLTDLSLIQGEYQAGSVIVVDDDALARGFIEAALAESVTDDPAPHHAAAPESAMLRDAPERATHPRARERGV